MTLSIHTIKRPAGAARKRKRIGRGNSSGTGTYSGRGLKGQKSRKGVSNLKRLGMKQVLLRIPKQRGFKSGKPKNQVVNIADISASFGANEAVNPETLFAKELINDSAKEVKILGKGELTVKGLEFSSVKVSASAKEAIEKAGGKINK